jgi:hypothetical protein
MEYYPNASTCPNDEISFWGKQNHRTTLHPLGGVLSAGSTEKPVAGKTVSQEFESASQK